MNVSAGNAVYTHRHFFFCHLFLDASRYGRSRPPRADIVVDHDHTDPDVGRVRPRSAAPQRVRRGHDERPPSPSPALGRRTERAPASPPSPSPPSRGGRGRCRGGRYDQRRRRHRAAASGHGHGPAGAGGVRGALQAAADQAGRDASGRGQGAGQPETAGCRRAVPEHHMPVRVADAVAQQHDRAEAHTAGVAGGSGGAGEEQAPGPGRAQRVAGRREEAEAHFHSGARETVAGGVLRGAAEAVGREDRGHCGETRPEEERGPGVVLQPEAKAKAHEVRGPTLTE